MATIELKNNPKIISITTGTTDTLKISSPGILRNQDTTNPIVLFTDSGTGTFDTSAEDKKFVLKAGDKLQLNPNREFTCRSSGGTVLIQWLPAVMGVFI
jgi:hypothetical protein